MSCTQWEKKAVKMLLTVFRYRQKVKRFQQNVNATIIQRVFRSYLIRNARENVMKLRQMEKQLKLMQQGKSSTEIKEDIATIHGTEIRRSNSFNNDIQIPKENSNLQRLISEDTVTVESSKRPNFLVSPSPTTIEKDNAFNGMLKIVDNSSEKRSQSMVETSESQSLQTEVSLEIEIPGEFNSLKRAITDEFSDKILQNKVQRLKLELAIVKKRYELGLINTPQRKRQKKESLEHLNGFIRKCGVLAIQRWYRRKKGLKRKHHIWSIIFTLETELKTARIAAKKSAEDLSVAKQIQQSKAISTQKEIDKLKELLVAKEQELIERKNGEDFHAAANEKLNSKIALLSDEMNAHKMALDNTKLLESKAHEYVEKLKRDIESHKAEIDFIQSSHFQKETERDAATVIQRFIRKKRKGNSGGLGSVILEMGRQLKFARETATKAQNDLESVKLEHTQTHDELKDQIQILQMHLEETEGETLQHLREKFYHEEENKRLYAHIESLKNALMQAETPRKSNKQDNVSEDRDLTEMEKEMQVLRDELTAIKNVESHKKQMANILSNVSHLGEALKVSVTGIHKNESTSATFFIIQVGMAHKTWITRRRFRQFSHLFDVLSARLQNQSLPSLPQRTFFSLSGAALEDRRRGLEEWLKSVIQIPSVWKYMEIVSFLDSDDENYLERMMGVKNDTTPA